MNKIVEITKHPLVNTKAMYDFALCYPQPTPNFTYHYKIRNTDKLFSNTKNRMGHIIDPFKIKGRIRAVWLAHVKWTNLVVHNYPGRVCRTSPLATR